MPYALLKLLRGFFSFLSSSSLFFLSLDWNLGVFRGAHGFHYTTLDWTGSNRIMALGKLVMGWAFHIELGPEFGLLGVSLFSFFSYFFLSISTLLEIPEKLRFCTIQYTEIERRVNHFISLLDY